MYVTNDLKEFGYREKEIAADLLKTLNTEKDKTRFLEDDITIYFNMNSGNVFLMDSNYNVAMLNGDILDDWIVCPECGNEGFYSEFKEEFEDCECCQEYFNDIVYSE